MRKCIPLILILYIICISFSQATTQTLGYNNNTGDAYVGQYTPNGNSGTHSTLVIRERDPYDVRTYIKFNISTLPKNIISIDYATLFLYSFLSTGTGGYNNASLYEVYVTNWSEGSMNNINIDIGSQSYTQNITWSNQPCGIYFNNSNNCNLTAEDSTIVHNTTYNNWSILNIITKNYDLNDNYISFIIKVPDTEPPNVPEFFYSKEGQYKPYITITYTPDIYPPLISGVSLNNTYPKKNIYVRFNATFKENPSNNELGSYMFSWNDGGNWSNTTATSLSGNSSTISLVKKITSVGGTNISYRFYVTDVVNNMNISKTYSFLVNNTEPPQVTNLIFPQNNSILGNDNPFLYWSSVTDLDLDAITYNLLIANDTAFSEIKYNYTGITLNNKTSDALPDNTYFWRLKSIDNESAQSAWSKTYTFTIDTTYPSITDEIFYPGIVYNNYSIRFNATINTTTTINNAWFSSNFTGEWVNYTISEIDTASYSYSFYLNSGNLSNQQKVYYKFMANNTLGKIAIGQELNFTVSNRLPYMKSDFTSPGTPKYPNSTYVYVNISDPDLDSISYVNFTFKAPNGTYFINNVPGINTNGFWNSSAFVVDDSGYWSWNITISDSYSTNKFSGSFFINDTVLPKITINSPLSGTTLHSYTITLNTTVTDNIRLYNCWYCDVNAIIACNTTVSCNAVTTYETVSEGLGNVTFYANDTRGNINRTISYYNLLIPASGGSIGGGGGSTTTIIINNTNPSDSYVIGDGSCDYSKGENKTYLNESGVYAINPDCIDIDILPGAGKTALKYILIAIMILFLFQLISKYPNTSKRR